MSLVKKHATMTFLKLELEGYVYHFEEMAFDFQGVLETIRLTDITVPYLSTTKAPPYWPFLNLLFSSFYIRVN